MTFLLGTVNLAHPKTKVGRLVYADLRDCGSLCALATRAAEAMEADLRSYRTAKAVEEEKKTHKDDEDEATPGAARGTKAETIPPPPPVVEKEAEEQPCRGRDERLPHPRSGRVLAGDDDDEPRERRRGRGGGGPRWDRQWWW